MTGVQRMDSMKLIVNGEEVFVNQFVSDVLRDVIHAVMKNLKGVEIDEIKTVEIS